MHIARNLDPQRGAPGALDCMLQAILTDEAKITYFHYALSVGEKLNLLSFLWDKEEAGTSMDLNRFWHSYIRSYPPEAVEVFNR